MNYRAATFAGSSPRHAGGWSTGFREYEELIHGSATDSKYLRETGLKPNILELIAGHPIRRALDVGCGDGWLFDAIRPPSGCECDIINYGHADRAWEFSVQDVARLTYPDRSFDLVVASLLLMWVEDLEAACCELFRVATCNSRAVISVMHPASYRIGVALENGDFMVQLPYSHEFVLADLYIANHVGPFRYFHRPLGRYVNALATAGWRITQFREWSIDMADYLRTFGAASCGGPRRSNRLPMYAFFQCQKDT